MREWEVAATLRFTIEADTMDEARVVLDSWVFSRSGLEDVEHIHGRNAPFYIKLRGRSSVRIKESKK